MLLSKLAKAKSGQPSSPRNNRQQASGSKRSPLEIFETFRQADETKGFTQATEAEIEAMLDDNLFRDDDNIAE